MNTSGMLHSDSLASIAPALVKAQSAFPAVRKDSTNPHFKSKFASLDAIVGAALPALHANGIALLQGGGPSDDGSLEVVTRLQHESGEWIQSSFRLPLAKADPQGAGSALTYGKRYSLAAMLGIVADEDDDGNAATKPAPAKHERVLPAAEGVTADQRKELDGLVASKVWSDKERESLLSRGQAMKTAKAMAGFLEKGIAEVVKRSGGAS